MYAGYSTSAHSSVIGAWASLADKLPLWHSCCLMCVHHLAGQDLTHLREGSTGKVPESFGLPILLVAGAGTRWYSRLMPAVLGE